MKRNFHDFVQAKFLQKINLKSMYLDVHTHTLPYSGMYNLLIKEVNALPEQYFSAGIHPWYIFPFLLAQQYSDIISFASHPNCRAIGEVGLDKICSTPWTLQVEVFERQIGIANSLQKPVIIHCVKAQQEILERKPKGKTPWILHGFNQKAIMGQQWLQHNFYVSFGKALLEPSSNASQFLPHMPLERLFLETDNANVSIETIYSVASDRLDLPLEKLESILQANFKRVFHI